MVPVILKERPDSEDAAQLISELEALLAPRYPKESRHGFSVEKLLNEVVAFFVLWVEDTAAGCGGIKFFGTSYGEIKRMYIRPRFRGSGLGKMMLNHLTKYAQQNGVGLLRLETGVYQTEAIRLYERWGFERIPPFGDYPDAPLSVFYEKRIS